MSCFHFSTSLYLGHAYASFLEGVSAFPVLSPCIRKSKFLIFPFSFSSSNIMWRFFFLCKHCIVGGDFCINGHKMTFNSCLVAILCLLVTQYNKEVSIKVNYVLFTFYKNLNWQLNNLKFRAKQNPIAMPIFVGSDRVSTHIFQQFQKFKGNWKWVIHEWYKKLYELREKYS